jgi:hypothetical protein
MVGLCVKGQIPSSDRPWAKLRRNTKKVYVAVHQITDLTLILAQPRLKTGQPKLE